MKHTIMNSMIRVFVVLALLAAPHSARAACTDPLVLMDKTIGISGGNAATSVATDANGFIYITGYFLGTVDMGGISLTSAGNYDIFVAKYSPTGVLQWAQKAGNTGLDFGKGIAVDTAGNVYVTGMFQGTINFGPPALVCVGSQDMFVAKLDTNGGYVFSVRYGAIAGNPGHTWPFGIAIDANGTYAITGEFNGTINLGGANHTSFGQEDIFVARYLNGGTFQWSKTFGSTMFDRGYGVAVDSGNNTIITGHFRGTVNFGGVNLVGGSVGTMYLAKYNSFGTHVWSTAFGTISEGTSVAVDASSNVFVGGDFTGSINMGGSTLLANGPSIECALAKYNSSGVHQWSKAFSGTGGERPSSLAIDAAGDVLLAVETSASSLDLGGGPLNSAGVVYGKFNTAGTHQWSATFSGDEGHITADASRNVVAAGTNGAIVIRRFLPDTVQPCIQAIVDVGNDQGRNVKISFFKSGYDRSGAPAPVVRYDAYRRDDPLSLVLATSDATSPGELSALGWQFVGSVPSHGESEYLLGAPTVVDSTLDGVHYSAFFIRASTANPAVFYDSEIDSGYSIDNLSPATPSNFVFNAGVLSWERSSARDFDHYSVYGANTDAFASAFLLSKMSEPGANVTASPYAFYFVTASDVSGNQSKPARLAAAPGEHAARVYTLGVGCYPNPFNPRTTVSYTAPSPGKVKVQIYDARGALVKTLAEGQRVAGAYSIEWDGRADNGDAVASGLYFARIEHNGVTRTKKMVLLK